MSDLNLEHQKQAAAVATLESMKYTWLGGIRWKPPRGKKPDFNLMDSLQAKIDKLQAQLEAHKWISNNTPKKAYLVGTFEQYEAGFTPYFAFLDKALADEFLADAIAFYATKPDYSDTDESWQLVTEWHKSTREKFGHMLLGNDELVIHDIELKANEAECKWISVKDRLPKEVVFYLVFTEIGETCECNYLCDEFTTGHIKGKKVTHWQPLPEPPKECE